MEQPGTAKFDSAQDGGRSDCLLVATPAATSLPRTCSKAGYDIRTAQELLGLKNVRITMIYTHVLHRRGRGVKNPVDNL